MQKIYFATGNKGKAQEAEHILGVDIEIADIELEEIQSLSAEKVVEHKVRQAYEKLKSPVFVDDVSLELNAWFGFPGPFIKHMHMNNNKRFLHMFRNETNRSATAISTLAYHDGKDVHFFTGKLELTVSTEERGANGWGLDPIWIPKGQNLTFAEMTDEQKNSISHRRLAMNKFKEYLDTQVHIDSE